MTKSSKVVPTTRAHAVTLRTYCRPKGDSETLLESWEEVNGRAAYDHHDWLWRKGLGEGFGKVDLGELAELRDLGIDRKATVAGRTLWLGGTKYAQERPCCNFNCSATSVSNVYDVVDVAWLLLNGSGVGFKPQVGTLHGYIKPIPELVVVPSTRDKLWKGDPENKETLPTESNDYTWTLTVGDSAEAWAKVIGKLFMPGSRGAKKLVIDGSNVRGPGGRLKGYGWICNGFPPLAECLTGIHDTLNKKAGHLLDNIDIGDCINRIGQVLSSRRSAQAWQEDSNIPTESEFASAKKNYWENGNNHRRQSNNSELFWSKPSKVKVLDLLYQMDECGGDPGIVNAEGARIKCPWFEFFNPCLTGDTLVAVADGRNAVPISQLVEESQGVNRFDVYAARPSIGGKGGKWVTEISSAVAIMTGTKRVGILTLSTGDTLRLTADHRVALADGTYCEAANAVGKVVESFFTKCDRKNRRLINTESNAYMKQHRLIWERTNGPKPAGYEIDHRDNDGGDYLDNLNLMSAEDHREKTSEERKGENNPIHRIRDKESYRRRKAVQAFGAANPRFKGLTDEGMIELATILHRDGIFVTLNNLRKLDSRVPTSLSKNRFGGSIQTLRDIASGLKEYNPPLPPESPPDAESEPFRREVVTVVSFEETTTEVVYDLIVEKNRNFYVITSATDADYLDSKGLLVHNCFEIMLGSFCNLVNNCLPRFGRNMAELERAITVISRANYRQTCVDLRDGVLQPKWHQTNDALRLCGVSLTGIVQADWMTDYQIRRLRNAAVAGAYSMADKLGLPRPKAVTTVTPAGTIAKVMGGTDIGEVAEGIHKPLGRYIFNWVNFSIHDPLVNSLEAAGYRTLPNPQDTKNVLVCFPVAYNNIKFTVVGGVEVNLEPATVQLDRYLRWNNLWADHNVSCTVSYSPHELPLIADWLMENWDRGYVATAFLRRTDPTLTARDLGHPYLPQEVVGPSTYHDYLSTLREVDWSVVTGQFDPNDDGCAKGGCPIR